MSIPNLCEHIVTANSKDQLKKQTLSVLKEYASVYNIPVNGVVEKDDLIDRLIAARVRSCVRFDVVTLMY